MATTILLLAEDDPVLRRVAERALMLDGFVVCSVSNGMEALDLAEYLPADALLLDEIMPGVGGLDVCRRVKADHRVSSVPVIVLGSQAVQVGERVARASGADGYISKPFDASLLGEEVRRMCADARAADAGSVVGRTVRFSRRANL